MQTLLFSFILRIEQVFEHFFIWVILLDFIYYHKLTVKVPFKFLHNVRELMFCLSMTISFFKLTLKYIIQKITHHQIMHLLIFFFHC